MPSPAREKLMTIKAMEEAKGRSQHARAPAIFRDTALDTHKSIQPEYFGPSTVPEKKEFSTRLSSGRTRSVTKHQRAAMEALQRTSQMAGQGEVRTVFMPTAEQMPVCAAAGERRGNVANSEWALLDTLEVNLYLNEKDARLRSQKAVQQTQRAILDTQVGMLAQAKLAAETAKAAERVELLATVAAHQAEERQRAEEQRAALTRLRTDREAMLAETRVQREAALSRKREEEAKLVAAAQAQLEADRQAAARKAAELKEQAAKTMADNEARLVARKAAEAAQRVADAETTKRMIEMAEAQDRARDRNMKSFHDMIQARARGVGQKAVDDRRDRLEREERLIAEAERAAAQREAERAAAEAERKARLKSDLVSGNEALKRAKAEKLAVEREAEARERAAAEQRVLAEKEAAERQMAGMRERATATKRFVAGQAAAVAERAKTDDIFMSEQERLLNKRLLEQAVATVQRPMQYSVKLY
ncbi:hypothetical protein CHLRE_02g145850v5 [Chlamydomonas reinhardtii]|uniref:Uncharacterized protein n=1 Tax=Chlamydomonas reinhardtii TaxID=3055 RepID=A8J0X0_CHLRE|nr:uncharacterized protein CHLRE_02g145850v5 [Chlamydomonas reinhardtii]6U42_4V Chain 4V, FAP112 [Chlamydomonas reinhardtii]6U42_4W Chain 4W, FAP112 [Chlamydomonas reinhardtii]6U42_4X Chain 4X, FAP112 [Chlamydomonas reinhardtii]8GLV_4Q Chain 4Q, Flagellar associated protein [Chlamydomonas reinhardtii]8GLV_4W Chain 4W, Flagellar associated protein [Chlamydomonas reinhardtii]8GLV_Nz Chain Nz, Flagellar associated protein [Chlamydomonas reinhardtii]PNW87427.1 hypothetical protein CHLRE_02g14585|eukprot:XP_001695004.1 flagellar associated protein [Chlamydomonas reinhardtii]